MKGLEIIMPVDIIVKPTDYVGGKRLLNGTDTHSHVSAQRLEYQSYKICEQLYYRENFLLIFVALFKDIRYLKTMKKVTNIFCCVLKQNLRLRYSIYSVNLLCCE